MPDFDFSKMPWLNQRELMFHFVKDFTAELRRTEGRLASTLMEALAKSLVATIGADKMIEIIRAAASAEIRTYLTIHGIRVSLPGTDCK